MSATNRPRVAAYGRPKRHGHARRPLVARLVLERDRQPDPKTGDPSLLDDHVLPDHLGHPQVPNGVGRSFDRTASGRLPQLAYAMIVRALSADNTKLAKRDRVTIDSIRNHTVRHFPVQNVAKATYREILERRAKANGVDFVEGVATAITPIAFFETIMVKSCETLVDSDTKVDVNTGMVAAGRLQSLIDSRDYSHDLLMMKVQLAAICDAVKSTVPQEMWGDIVQKLEEAEQHQESLDVGEDSYDCADDDPFDPTEFIDDDDDEF